MKQPSKKKERVSMPQSHSKGSTVPANWTQLVCEPGDLTEMSEESKGDLALQIIRDMTELEHRQREYNKAMRMQLRVLRKHLQLLAQDCAK